jgi:NAD(P)H-flavin reductase
MVSRKPTSLTHIEAASVPVIAVTAWQALFDQAQLKAGQTVVIPGAAGKAMLESLMDNSDCPPVSLYWGSRSTDDLYLHKQIHTWGERLCDFNYVPVLSRADGAWAGRRGYVQDAVTADLGDLAEYAIYLCGSPEMIASAKQAFFGRGASIDHVYSEGFVRRRTEGSAPMRALHRSIFAAGAKARRPCRPRSLAQLLSARR